jgi:hypothetical protein
LHEFTCLIGDDSQPINFRYKQHWWFICEPKKHQRKERERRVRGGREEGERGGREKEEKQRKRGFFNHSPFTINNKT